MKKSAAVLLTALIMSFVLFSFASNEITVRINYKTVAFPDAKPFISNSRTMVPVRFISENLGAKVEWNGADRIVTVNQGSKTITLIVGKTTALVDGNEVAFDAPAMIKSSRTFVPLRFVSEALGVKVSWEAAKRLVQITDANYKYENGFVLPVKPVCSLSFYDTNVKKGLLTLNLDIEKTNIATQYSELTEILSSKYDKNIVNKAFLIIKKKTNRKQEIELTDIDLAGGLKLAIVSGWNSQFISITERKYID